MWQSCLLKLNTRMKSVVLVKNSYNVLFLLMYPELLQTPFTAALLLYTSESAPFMLYPRIFTNRGELLSFLLLTVWLWLYKLLFGESPRYPNVIGKTFFFWRDQISREISIHSKWKLSNFFNPCYYWAVGLIFVDKK